MKKRRTSKKDRLIASAQKLINLQGYMRTTLADVASEAGVPLGNIYYYFKTKKSLLHAVVEYHREQLSNVFLISDSQPRPVSHFLDKYIVQADEISKYGDPVFGLCHELNKSEDEVERSFSNDLISTLAEFLKKHTEELKAEMIVCKISGACLLSETFRNPGLVVAAVNDIKVGIDGVV